MRYIMSELEEIEREDNFRLKRFKELKYKNKKGDENTNKRCYCKKQPEKGDDFVCLVCKEEEERKQSKKSPCEVKIESGVEVIGDKASSLSTVKQKRLGDLNSHLEKVISLTCQCKLDGLVSQSVDRLIYACEEVQCKLETDQKQTTAEEQVTETCCSPCEAEVPVKESQEVPPSKEEDRQDETKPEEKKYESEEDSLGYFETKYKETVKVMKFKNEDGTISEERQVVTIKTEKKHPHKPNKFGMSPCCKVKQIASITSEESKSDSRDAYHPKQTKSEEITSCIKKEQTKVRSCVSESGSREKRKKESNESSKESSILKCSTVCDAATDPDLRSIICPKECPSETLSNKSKVSMKPSIKSNKSLKMEPSKKDVACECKTVTKSVCCDPIWKDVATSTTGLAETFKTDGLSVCIKETEFTEPNATAEQVSLGQKSANNIKICCDKRSDEAARSISSHTCSTCSKGNQTMKDISTTTSNIVLEKTSIKDKPSTKHFSCLSPLAEIKCSSKINERPKPCFKDTKPNEKPKTCCKIRIISNQIGSKDKNVQEFMFFGNIIDAIKKILVPSNSEESVIKTRDSKASKNANTLSTKCSVKSSLCKSCEAVSKFLSKGVEKSQSCPQCNEKSVEKSMSRYRVWSKSADNTKEPKPSSYTSHADHKKCSVCGSELLKVMKPDTTSAENEEDECLSCEIESCTLSKSAASSAIDINDQKEDPCVCSSSKKSIIKPTESKCKICNHDKTQSECYPSNNVNKQIAPPKPKCKVCYLEEDPCNCPPKDKNQEKPKKTEDAESKCKKCFSGEIQNTSKSSQNETICRKEHKTSEKAPASDICPLCSKDQKTKLIEHDKKSTDSLAGSNSGKFLCCDSSRADRDDVDCKKCNGVVMKDASTSTRRSDRYDVRPLKLMMPGKKLTCTCQSDSYLTHKSCPPPTRSSSCHANYCKHF